MEPWISGLRALDEVLDTADAIPDQGGERGRQGLADRLQPAGRLPERRSPVSGELVLVGGPQGFGKTTWVLQVLRNIVAGGDHGVYFSYEHDEYTVLERLLALEAGLLYGAEAVGLRRIRSALEAVDGRGDLALDARLANTNGGQEALQAVRQYSKRLFFARANGATTDLREIAARTEQIMEADRARSRSWSSTTCRRSRCPTARPPRRSGSRSSPRG